MWPLYRHSIFAGGSWASLPPGGGLVKAASTDETIRPAGAGCRCIQRVSIWLTLYTCDDSRAQYLACNSLILRKQN